MSYEGGKDVRKDLKTALEWLRKAADAGNPQAQKVLAPTTRKAEAWSGTSASPPWGVKKSREGVAPHDDDDHATPPCPAWMNTQLQQKAGCSS